ncbi:uncharacterized protein [Watersipora subatra]
MPKRMVGERKVKEVIMPEGDEGKQLTQRQRAAKLKALKEQINQEMQQHLEELDADCLATCRSIELAGKALLVQLTPEEASMPISEYRRKVLQLDDRRVSEVEGANISDILENVENNWKQGTKPIVKEKKITGFATPAVSRDTMWTATPQQTPLFDKRLLKVATGKPSGISLSGQAIENIDMTKLSKAKKEELSNLFTAALQKLK